MLQKIKNMMLVPLVALSSFFAPMVLGGVIASTALAVGNGGAVLADAQCSATGNVTCPSTGVCAGATNLQLGTSNNNSPGNADCTGNDQTSKVNNLISTILNIFSVVVGIIAVVMIIYAGFKYITSGGKDESVKTAKNTILYAVIGLVIVALAQIIVKFVLSKATNPTATG